LLLMKCTPALLLVILALLTVGLVAGCSSVSKEQAEATGISYIRDNVKFYSQYSNNSNKSNQMRLVTQYRIRIINSTKKGGTWIMFAEVNSSVSNKTRNAMIRVGVDSSTNKVVIFEQIRPEESFK
jgi:hypothetical protein